MQWVTTSLQSVVNILGVAAAAYVALIAMVRINGLRTFSKMSSFDFAVTVAVGSILASTVVSKNPPLLQGLTAIAALIFFQSIISRFRTTSDTFENWTDNCPVLLMDGPDILTQNLEKCRVTRSDLRAKLREANVLHYGQVKAVVLETTGEISVLHGSEHFDESLLEGVKRSV